MARRAGALVALGPGSSPRTIRPAGGPSGTGSRRAWITPALRYGADLGGPDGGWRWTPSAVAVADAARRRPSGPPGREARSAGEPDARRHDARRTRPRGQPETETRDARLPGATRRRVARDALPDAPAAACSDARRACCAGVSAAARRDGGREPGARARRHPPDRTLSERATREAFELYARYWYETFALRTMPVEEVNRRFSSMGDSSTSTRPLERGPGRGPAPCRTWGTGTRPATGSAHQRLPDDRRRGGAPAAAAATSCSSAPRGARDATSSALTEDGQVGRQLAAAAGREPGGDPRRRPRPHGPRRRGRDVRRAQAAAGRPGAARRSAPARRWSSARSTRRDDGWAVRIGAPLEFERTRRLRADVAALTRLMAERFERAIAAAPTDWHMFQPAWRAVRRPPAGDAGRTPVRSCSPARTPGTRPGGVQVHVRQLADALAVAGPRRSSSSPPARARRQDAGVRIVGRPVRVPVPAAPSRRSRPRRGRGDGSGPRCASFEPDVVHAHEPFTPSDLDVRDPGPRAPVVATFHASLDRSRLWSSPGRCSGGGAADRRPRRGLGGGGGVRAARRGRPVEIVPNGVDVERSRPGPARRRASRPARRSCG